ncbi:MAG: TlpA family protein disulfide reductase [Deltaproteobacteria bacterium]|nr:TlpA family protein disulfide reductase [Deltaproteobacteria bacterium]
MHEKVRNDRRISPQSTVLIVLAVISVGIIFLLQTKDSTFSQLGSSQFQKGKPAPPFSLPNLDGNMVSLGAYKGKVVFLNIWATWCPPCVEEMPSMEKLFQSLNKEDFEILAVNIDASGLKAVRPFMKKHRLHFPVLIDPKGTIQRLYRTTGIPESIIIDKNGIIVEKIMGARDWGSNEAIRYFQDLIQKN